MIKTNIISENNKIAVIIPLYNGEKWIRKTLDSVFNQHLKADEIIVVDDGSTDNSWKIVSQIKGIRLFKNPLKEANRARAFGFAQSNCSMVAMIDQDDILHPEHFERLNNLLLKHPESPAAIASVTSFEKDSGILFNHDRPISEEYELVDIWGRFPFNYIPTPSSVLMRTAALIKAGGWPINWPGMADSYCWFALALQSSLILSKTKTLARRVHQSSYSTALRKKSSGQYYRIFIKSSRHLLSLKKGSEKTQNSLSRRLDALALANPLISLDNPNKADTDVTVIWKKLGDLYLTFPKDIQDSFCSTIKWYFKPDTTDFKNNRQWVSFITSGLNSGFPKIQKFTKHCSEEELSYYLRMRDVKSITRLHIFIQLVKRKFKKKKFKQK